MKRITMTKVTLFPNDETADGEDTKCFNAL